VGYLVGGLSHEGETRPGPPRPGLDSCRPGRYSRRCPIEGHPIPLCSSTLRGGPAPLAGAALGSTSLRQSALDIMALRIGRPYAGRNVARQIMVPRLEISVSLAVRREPRGPWR
jgi:hypothetical protein